MRTRVMPPVSFRERLRWFSLKCMDQNPAEGRSQACPRRLPLTSHDLGLAVVALVVTLPSYVVGILGFINSGSRP
jgi:hypothetical protein